MIPMQRMRHLQYHYDDVAKNKEDHKKVEYMMGCPLNRMM